MTLFGVLRSPRLILFGRGQRNTIGRVAREIGRRAFVCTDARLAADPEFGRLMGLLSDAGVDPIVYDGTLPDVPTPLVADAVEHARAADVDLVIGIGGGSCLDLAKTVAVIVAHGGQISDYYGEHAVPGPTLPLVALPTTAGTGSEVTTIAVLTDPERTIKVGVSSPYLVPEVAICDPELSFGCPPGLTASAAIDALSHGIESFTAVARTPTSSITEERVFVGKNELTDHYALLAVRSVANALRRAYRDGNDVDAREQLMLGAMAGGYALATGGTAAAHALQYPVGALTDTPHGVGVGVLLPYVMEFNLPYCVDSFARIAVAMGLDDGSGDDERLARKAVDGVAELCADVGIPRTLAELGLPADRLDWAAEQAVTAKRLVENNPRPLDVDGLTRISYAAHAGDRGALLTGSD